MSDETYWRRLKRHPGIPILLFWCAAAFLMCRGDWVRGLIGAGVFLLIFGPAVLWTARA